MNTTTTLLNLEAILNEDILTGPLAASPLALPITRLADDLNALVRNGHLQGVELELKSLDCPCFLLHVTANTSPFYIELFRGDLDDPFVEDEEAGEEVADEEVTLCVLMNWLGSDTEPAFWETEWQADFGEDVDFGEVLSHILFMTEAQQTKGAEADAQQTRHGTVIK